MNGFIKLLFFGNYFYGFCAIGLSMEASLQQRSPLNSIPYYILAFCVTVLYYTHAYIVEPTTNPANKRSVWYGENKPFIIRSQWFLTIVCVITAVYWLYTYLPNLKHINSLHIFLLLVFPLAAVLYYGSSNPSSANYSLRNNGWLKPFVIGFVWAGSVTVYPVLFSSIELDMHYFAEFLNILLFIKNFMFISMLCIMFDIKDYASDHNRRLKTFVVQIGLRRTIFSILIPLSVIGLGTFLIFATYRQFPLFRILINTIPFILLIIVAYSMHRRKSILYYLAIIDGLMLAKAFCGILGMILIN